MRGGRDGVAHLRECRGEEGVMRIVGPCDPRRRPRSASAYFSGTIAGAAEVAPEALRMIRVEPHRLADPLDPLLGPPEPGQDLALLHDNEVVVRD